MLAKAGRPAGGDADAVRLGVGGPLGSGRQWWSWIHRDDAVGVIIHLLGSDYNGPVMEQPPSRSVRRSSRAFWDACCTGPHSCPRRPSR